MKKMIKLDVIVFPKSMVEAFCEQGMISLNAVQLKDLVYYTLKSYDKEIDHPISCACDSRSVEREVLFTSFTWSHCGSLLAIVENIWKTMLSPC